MSCRTNRGSSAITSYARTISNSAAGGSNGGGGGSSGLSDMQNLSLFHRLVREGEANNSPPPSPSTVRQWLQNFQNEVRQNTALSDSQRERILQRVTDLDNQSMPNGAMFYAWQQITPQAQNTASQLDRAYTSIANDLGVDRQTLQNRIRQYEREYQEQPNRRSRPENATQVLEGLRQRINNNASTPSVLPQDPTTLAVWSRLMSEADAARNQANRNNNVNGSQTAEVGGAANQGGQQQQQQRQCPNCGQFMGANHVCQANSSSSSGAATFARRLVSNNNDMDLVAFGYNPQRELLELEFPPREIEPDGTVVTGYQTDPQTGIPRATRRPALENEPNQVMLYRGVPPEILAEIEDSNGAVLNTRFLIERLLLYRVGQEDATTPTPNTSDSGLGDSDSRPSRSSRRQEINNSTSIASLDYNPDNQQLIVEFQTGRVYEYSEVPTNVYEELAASGSVGRSYNTLIRNQYPSRQMENGEINQWLSATPAIAATNDNSSDNTSSPQTLQTATTNQVSPELAAARATSEQAQAQAVANRHLAEQAQVRRYSEDMSAFQAVYNEAKARKERGEPPIPYLTENATGGLGARNGGRGFGVELEFDMSHLGYIEKSEARFAIGRELYAAGLTTTDRQEGYHSSDDYTRWRFEEDSTVSGEIISPIMYDEPQSWEQLQKVCEIVQRNGGKATVRTGGHVHVACGNYDHTPKNHNNLLRLYKRNEDVTYRLAANPERGRHRGRNWCYPNRVPATDYAQVEQVRQNYSSHNVGLNFQAVQGQEQDHVEFRMWDGSLDPAVIQSQIKISLGMTEAAFRAEAGAFRADSSTNQSELIGQHKSFNSQNHGRTRQLRGAAWEQDTKSFRQLVDTIFSREEDKEQATALFAVTKWQDG